IRDSSVTGVQTCALPISSVACVMHDVIAALTVGYDLLVGAIFVPILAAMVADRGSPRAALISIMASALMVVTLILVYGIDSAMRSEEHTSELQSHLNLVC